MLDQDQTEATEIAQLPRNKDGSIRKTFVKSVARRIETGDATGLRGLVGDLHEADMGDLIEALEPEQRPRLVALLGIDFDFTALTEVDDAVRDEILDELPPQAVAKGVSELESDDAVAILEDLPKDEQAEILEQLPQPDRATLARSLDYPEEVGRPAHADGVHRRAAGLERRSGDRLHARNVGIAGALLRALRH